jgi:hypothetical protein
MPVSLSSFRTLRNACCAASLKYGRDRSGPKIAVHAKLKITPPANFAPFAIQVAALIISYPP